MPLAAADEASSGRLASGDQRERVRTGEKLDRFGQTESAAGTPCHLHFEIHVHGRPVDPEPSLQRWDHYG